MRSNQFRARAAGHANRVARRRLIAALAALLAAAVLAWPVGAQERGAAPSIELTGTIDPATAGWISSALEDAQGARLAIVRVDTPGGLDTSMREIVQDIIAAPMPVVVYVTPKRAEDQQLIDLVAPEETALLRALDGFRVQGPKAGELDTDGLRVER